MFKNPFKKQTPEDYACNYEFRAEGEEGIFSGYICLWDQIDSYRTKFAKGAFAKTIKNNFEKIKVFYDHEKLIGKPLEMREDEKGVFVRGQVNLNTTAGSDVWQFLKDGTLDGLSFRFRATRPDKFENGVRVIQEVEVREFGPVNFQAGERSLITELRAATFDQNLTARQLRDERHQLISALLETLDSIHWESPSNSVDQVDSAVTVFHTRYLEWVGKLSTVDSNMRGEILTQNDLASAVRSAMGESTVEDFAKGSGLGVNEVETLLTGELLENRSGLDKVDPAVKLAHQKLRSAKIEELCWELRKGNLTNFEIMRVSALLPQPQPRAPEEDYGAVVDALSQLRSTYAKGGENA